MEDIEIIKNLNLLKNVLDVSINNEQKELNNDDFDKLKWILNELKKIKKRIKFSDFSFDSNSNSFKILTNLKECIDNLNVYVDYILDLDDDYSFLDKILYDMENRDVLFLITNLKGKVKKIFIKNILVNVNSSVKSEFLINGIIEKLSQNYIDQNRLCYENFTIANIEKILKTYELPSSFKRELLNTYIKTGNFKLMEYCIKTFIYKEKYLRTKINLLLLNEYSFDMKDITNLLLEYVRSNNFILKEENISFIEESLFNYNFGKTNYLDLKQSYEYHRNSRFINYLNDLRTYFYEEKSADEMASYELEEEIDIQEINEYISIISEMLYSFKVQNQIYNDEQEYGVKTIFFDKQKLIDELCLILISKIKTKEQEDLVLAFYNRSFQDETIANQKLVKTLSNVLDKKNKKISEI